MLVPRIWSDEVERIGKQRCTPTGYSIQLIGELIGFVGLLMLLVLPAYFGLCAVNGTFRWSLLSLLVVPFLIGVIDTLIVKYSWHLADRKQFSSDCGVTTARAGRSALR